MPDIYVMNDWISQSIVIYLLGIAVMYGVYAGIKALMRKK